MSLKYRSKLEEEVHKLLGPEYLYEKAKFNYTSSHVYTPDFHHPKDPRVLIEVKGRFRTSAEAAKYIDIARDNNVHICFVFGNPDNKMPGAKRRKDGTINTMKTWALKHGFSWTTLEELKNDKSSVHT